MTCPSASTYMGCSELHGRDDRRGDDAHGGDGAVDHLAAALNELAAEGGDRLVLQFTSLGADQVGSTVDPLLQMLFQPPEIGLRRDLVPGEGRNGLHQVRREIVTDQFGEA